MSDPTGLGASSPFDPASGPPSPSPEPGSHHHRSPDDNLGRVLLAAAIVVVLVLVAGGTTWWMYTRDPVAAPAAPAPASSAPACPSPSLRVVAAPEIAPVVREAAHTIGPARGGCSPIEVTAEEPYFTSSGRSSSAGSPDVWIPSSSAWLRVSDTAKAYTSKGDPLATSPIVLAAPTAVHERIAQGDRSSWAKLVGGVTGADASAVTMPDPERSTVGMLSVYAINQAMARTTDDQGIAQLRALALRSRLRSADADPAALLARVAGEWNTDEVASAVGAFPITEQQLTAYQRGGHTVQLDGAFTTDSQVEADYPFAVLRTTGHRDLADRLHNAIGRTALTGAGFRTARSAGSLTLPAKPEALLGPARTWSGYRTFASQVLLLIDASGSMNDRIVDRSGRATTRAALLRESGREAARLFADDTSIGMWYFGAATPSSPAHTEAVPFGPIAQQLNGKPRRDMLTAALTGYRADTHAGTPLFRTVLDASAAMREVARPGAVSMIVVLTDGQDGETKYAMPPAQFLAGLKSSAPIPIIAVGYGPDADMTTLRAMASATGGKAIAASDPDDLAAAMAQAFLAAHRNR